MHGPTLSVGRMHAHVCICRHDHGKCTHVHQRVHALWLSVSTSTRVCDSAFPHTCACMRARLLHEQVCIGVNTCCGGYMHVCVVPGRAWGSPRAHRLDSPSNLQHKPQRLKDRAPFLSQHLSSKWSNSVNTRRTDIFR